MSELNIGGGCHECGAQYEHKEFCSKKTSPPVYDMTEFERQLERKRHDLISVGEREALVAVRCVLDAIKASKREAK